MRLIAKLIIAALVVSCVITAPSSALGKSKASMWKGELPIRQPWLRDHMPDDALIYFRMPHILGLLATPKGNSMDSALRSEANVENLIKIRKGIADNVLQHLPMFADLRIRLLQQHLRSPIEVAAFMTPAPSALIAVNLDLDSNAALYEMLEVFSLIDPNFALDGPLDEQGMGQVIGLDLPLFVQFDAGSGRLLLNSGPAVTQESFTALMQAVSATNQHRMQVMESTIDESGQGLFFWIDAEQAMPSLQTFLQPEQLATLHDTGFDEVRSAAFGWGVANGKGRLAIVADVPAEDSRELLPYVNNDLSAKSVGDPDALAVMSIPTAAEFERIERLALESASAESQAEWVKGKASFHELSGISIEDILSAVGPEILLIFDQAGDYFAMRVRDKALLDDIIERVAISTGDHPDEKQIGGETYFHWSLPGELGWMDEVSADEIGWLGTLMHNQRDHLYWTIDGEFLYAASVPQILIDRAAMGAKTDVGEWLSDKQRIDGSHAVLSLTGTSRKLPKRFYAMYIELLQFFADISKTDIDIWSMPTAAQLDLPTEGAIGFTVHFGDPYLAVELMFENSPMDGLISAGGSGIVVVGILAAVAIPAYQDYTIRAKVSEGLNLAAGVKVAITEHYQDNGQFPGPADAALLSIPERAGEYVWSITVEPDTGIIIVVFNDDALPEGGTLYLEPFAGSDGSVSWTCSGTIENKHLPAACRDNTPPISEPGGA